MAILLVMRGGIDARVTAGLLSQLNEQIVTAGSIADARRRLGERPWLVVVLEATLPDGNAAEVVAVLAKSRFEGAIAILGAAADVGERIALLEGGADDYLTMPYDPSELVARIAALLRRAHRRVEVLGGGVVRTGLFELDAPHLTILLPGARRERLTPAEARLLYHMMTHPGRVMGHQELGMHILSIGAEGSTDSARISSNLIGVHITRVRRKIEPYPARPRLIVTVRGRGYRFDVPDESEQAPRGAARGDT